MLVLIFYTFLKLNPENLLFQTESQGSPFSKQNPERGSTFLKLNSGDLLFQTESKNPVMDLLHPKRNAYQKRGSVDTALMNQLINRVEKISPKPIFIWVVHKHRRSVLTHRSSLLKNQLMDPKASNKSSY